MALKLAPHDFIMIRRPLLPLTVLNRLNKRIARKPASFGSELCAAYKHPVLREALYLASPELYRQLIALENAGTENQDAKVLLSLYKYLVRASSRCTPFGLFAGYSIAGLAEKTQVSYNGKIAGHTTLSAHVLQQIGSGLTGSGTDRLLGVNSSLYPAGDCYRYVRRIAHGDGRFEFVGKEIIKDPYLEAALLSATYGSQPGRITRALVEAGMCEKHTDGYLNQLLKEQILVGSTQPTVSTCSYQAMISAAPDRKSIHTRVFDSLAALATRKPGTIDRFAALTSALREAQLPQDNPVQIDMQLQTAIAYIGQKPIFEIISGLGKLLSHVMKPMRPALAGFIRRFVERYGERQLPLLQALDPDYGIGYNQLQALDAGHFQLGRPVSESTPESPAVDAARTQLIDRAFHHAHRSGRPFYLLTTEDLASLKAGKAADYAEGLAALGTVICASQADFDRGAFFFELKALSGPGSMGLLSRFADADKGLAKKVEDVRAWEAAQYPDAILAEVLYAPCGREANVSRRPALGGLHITFLSGPAGAGTSIPASDLMVSVRGDQLILTSSSHNQRIVPRMTTAHNAGLGPPAYQMLADLAASDTAQQALWQWGHLSGYPFLPRIQYGKIILSKACWNIRSCMLPAKAAGETQILHWWQTLRHQLKIPRWVELGDNDRQLLIDGACAPAVRILLESLRKNGDLQIREVLTSPRKGLLSAGRLSYCNQLVIPIKNLGYQPAASLPCEAATLAAKRRPSEKDGWFYVKLYASEPSCEKLLTGKLHDFCTQLVKTGQIDEFLYLRYQDPEPHIRLRFYTGRHRRFACRIWSRLLEVLQPEMESGLVSRLQTQVYERELERYSALPYPAVETIFYHDSRMAMLALRLLSTDGKGQDRWLVAMLACQGMLAAFGLDMTGARQLLSSAGNTLKKSELLLLDRQFRKDKARIIDFMGCKTRDGITHTSIREALEARNMAISSVLAGHPPVSGRAKTKLVIDLMHLSCNRLFASDQRRQEHCVYYFLKKYYDYRLKVGKSTCENLICNHY